MTETKTLHEADVTSSDIVELSPMFLMRWEEPQQSHVLLYPEGLVKLNESAAAILEQCKSPSSVNEIVGRLCNLYRVNDIESDVMDFIATSLEKGWLRRA
ncbi:MAG TPA: pyrroloquinoline quinone biosynthesis peptide chaperone PqqD [Candidatus Sulfotelmatobacter sp.]|jgi:pyrroloquinoline quinone biosynthesis protein D|nr:pyrroloquinoline quinone biosynthesis peptide chaperone PqqD [Candidatus Sulfotelmatobacter sp.]